MLDFITIALCVLAYLLGSISSAIIVCKIMGIEDPRSAGSNNPGATNVLRIGGKKAAIITLLGDALKGVIPVIVAHAAGLSWFGVALVGLFAFLGHLFPLFFQFKGGKGVATAVGVAFAFSLFSGIVFALAWLIVAFITRYSSLSALLASLTLPMTSYVLSESIFTAVLFATMVIGLWIRHQQNIKNLLNSTEDKIGKKKQS